MEGVDTRDAYGFLVRHEYVKKFREYSPLYQRDEMERAEQWERFLFPNGHTHGGGLHNLTPLELEKALKGTAEESEPPGPRRDEEIQALVRQGVPMAVRGILWQVFLKVPLKWEQGAYAALVKRTTTAMEGKWENENTCKNGTYEKSGGPPPRKYTSQVQRAAVNQIEKDLARTFPGHPAMEGGGRAALRRLLTAYARFNPGVGYCQGMNFVAGMLLLHMPEEAAFWSLCALVEDVFPGYYSQAMVAAQVDQLVLQQLVDENLPQVGKRMESLCTTLMCVGAPWFLCLFVNALPGECVLRVWDVLLFERSKAVLFRVALALCEINTHALLSIHDSGEMIQLLQALAPSSFDSNRLMATACGMFQGVTVERLQELHELRRPEVVLRIAQATMEFSEPGSSEYSTSDRPVRGSPYTPTASPSTSPGPSPGPSPARSPQHQRHPRPGRPPLHPGPGDPEAVQTVAAAAAAAVGSQAASLEGSSQDQRAAREGRDADVGPVPGDGLQLGSSSTSSPARRRSLFPNPPTEPGSTGGSEAHLARSLSENSATPSGQSAEQEQHCEAGGARSPAVQRSASWGSRRAEKEDEVGGEGATELTFAQLEELDAEVKSLQQQKADLRELLEMKGSSLVHHHNQQESLQSLMAEMDIKLQAEETVKREAEREARNAITRKEEAMRALTIARGKLQRRYAALWKLNVRVPIMPPHHDAPPCALWKLNVRVPIMEEEMWQYTHGDTSASPLTGDMKPSSIFPSPPPSPPLRGMLSGVNEIDLADD
ncbi:hypothetical protein CYMTET_5762 [Cymbomonas tetramitiformis]|uniref:Rab-GAP TBC domain-containing protein n=1 Tax=Cymbomonas tetramitiformis TaxID=36881 RepID=A0AAE0GYS5_9CHLO|nr:hypothetical protein CYMTET_5762 [Cymbomonas tetramitiformis]